MKRDNLFKWTLLVFMVIVILDGCTTNRRLNMLEEDVDSFEIELDTKHRLMNKMIDLHKNENKKIDPKTKTHSYLMSI